MIGIHATRKGPAAVTTEVLLLSVGSPFSQEVFKRIRPSIPRDRWPNEALRATFTPVADGMALQANIDGLPTAYAQAATRIILQAGLDMVVKSPVAFLAAGVVRAKRWRDVFMFAAVPLLFAIPLMSSLASSAMAPASALFGANLVALLLSQIVLIRRRLALGDARFVAEIPVPGLRLQIAARR